jgi:isopropylmalate/homocitrate/citramalate synthase
MAAKMQDRNGGAFSQDSGIQASSLWHAPAGVTQSCIQDKDMAGQAQVTLVEVGPRDGLQYERGFFPTPRKIELVDILSGSGLKRIEVTSFVHPKAVPQLADAAEVMSGITKKSGIVYSALVPNMAGCRAALDTPADQLAMFVSASQAHNQKKRQPERGGVP